MLMRDDNGKSLLHWGAENGYPEVVRTALDQGEHIEARDEVAGSTALHLAAVHGHKGVVELLLDRKADINAKDDLYGVTALSLAVSESWVAVAELLIARGADVNICELTGCSTLHRAVLLGLENLTERLIGTGALVNARDLTRRATPLHDAAAAGQLECMRVLIARGAEVEALDKDGWTPLHVAVLKGENEAAMLLLDFGADVNRLETAYYHSPVDIADKDGLVELAAALRARGGRPSSRAARHLSLPRSELLIVSGGRIIQ